ncbi:hypothetical protein LAZ67_X003125 [Cordylochernes scorpioides]|uniref:Uncharacterized protein n=1 Tax=Cordylochernes scorpioides TaxID=51811 RepID=A0ABY6LWF3_9ARAC|nr:hypothetical protein LAZ67_X003125 [Cordylochernes scorpioides]
MQDGGSPHIYRGAKQLLKDTFGEIRGISRHFIYQWPPLSPDLTPYNFGYGGRTQGWKPKRLLMAGGEWSPNGFHVFGGLASTTSSSDTGTVGIGLIHPGPELLDGSHSQLTDPTSRRFHQLPGDAIALKKEATWWTSSKRCCLKKSDCCLPPTPVYFLEYSRRFYQPLCPVLRPLSFTVKQLLSMLCELETKKLLKILKLKTEKLVKLFKLKIRLCRLKTKKLVKLFKLKTRLCWLKNQETREALQAQHQELK